tara:strand:+ start:189 stop:347 length:159 start_codon:yes stop_codon:yes gene_type:complete
MKGQRKLSDQAWRWAFYDWANSAFATTVMAGFFPIFLNHIGLMICQMLKVRL